MDLQNSPQFQSAQQRARESLQDAFAAGEIELRELESRLVQVERATQRGHLAQALAGLRMPATRAEVVNAGPSRVRPLRTNALVSVGEILQVRVYFSQRVLSGPFEMPQRMRILNFAGRMELDFREATWPESVSLEIRSVWGQTHILVPASVQVTCHSYGLWSRLPAFRSETLRGDGARVHIMGTVIGGGLEVTQSQDVSWTARAQRSLRRFWTFR